MSEQSHIARPYAQAVFQLAKESGDYQRWSDLLSQVAMVAADPQMAELSSNPRISRSQLYEVVSGVVADGLFDEAANLIRLIVENGRIGALPAVAERFEILRAVAEGKVDAELISALEVSDTQRDAIAASLAKRLGREVNLKVVEDPTLVGGAVIRAGDLVIDASLKGRLERFTAMLGR